MMKKLFAAILALVFLFAMQATAVCESEDLGSLSFSDLKELKQRVDFEYYSRSESEPHSLIAGMYEVGVDIAPGRYYLACVEANDSGYTTRLHVYKDKEQYDSRPSGYYGDYLLDEYFSLGDDPISISLEEDNFLFLQSGSILVSPTPFKSSDYFVYELPEGTLVPAGVYDIGENGDIPVGKYHAYAGTVAGGDAKLYYTKEAFTSDGSWHLGYDVHYEISPAKDSESVGLILEEGYVLLVEEDIVMKKQQKLVFE